MNVILILSIFLIFPSILHAEVSASQINEMLSQMVKENVISAQEAQKTRIKMYNLSPEQWSRINVEARSAAGRYPASATVASNNKIHEVNKIDLDGAQFKQIQDDMKKIMPSL